MQIAWNSRKPRVTLERAFLFIESFKTTEGQPLVPRWAKGLKPIAENIPITIFDDELIVGWPDTWFDRCTLVYPELDGSPEVRADPGRGGHGLKAKTLQHDSVLASLKAPNYLLKIIPDVDGGARICEVVRYYLQDVTVKGVCRRAARLELFHHALAPVAQLPVLEVVSEAHILTDLTLGLGRSSRLSRPIKDPT